MEFVGFDKKALEFLKRIRENNSKEWFELHKEEYKKLILEPSRAFVVEMGEHLQALVPTINALPKMNHSLYKIYRDTRRMGANKAPIKERIGFIFWQGNTKRMQSSAFYLHFSPEELMVAVGVRWFERPMLEAYREYILDDERRSQLADILMSIKAKDTNYTHLEGGFKRYPRGFNAAMSHADLSLYKGMATFVRLSPDLICDGEQLISRLYKIFEDMLPLQEFMYEVSLHIKED